MEYPYIKNITHEKVQTLTSLVNAEDGQIVSKTLAQNEAVSVIERGLKTMRLDNFVAIANALDVSADSLLSDVVTKSTEGQMNELSEAIRSLPSDEQNRLTKALRAYLE